MTAHAMVWTPAASTETIQMRVNGLALAVEVAGDGPASCVLVHGFGDNRAAWAGVSAALEGLGKVFSVDLRGHGESEWDRLGRYTVEDHAADLAGLLAALELPRYVVIGHSMGGAAALRVAAKNPAGMAGLVLVDYGPEPSEAGADRVTAEFRASSRGYASIAEYAGWLASVRPLANAAVVQKMAEAGLRPDSEGGFILKRDPAMLASRMSGAPRPDVWRDLATTKCPIHILRGTGSSILTKAVAEEMTRTAQRGSLATVAMAGHGVMIDNPPGFVAATLPFVAERLRT